MTPQGRARLCRHCVREVHDLAQYTAEEALALVARSPGGICGRAERREDGKVATRPGGLAALFLAVAAVPAVLMPMTSAGAAESLGAVQGQISKLQAGAGPVRVTAAGDGVTLHSDADQAGGYRIDQVPPGSYSLTFAAGDFSWSVADVTVCANHVTHQDIEDPRGHTRVLGLIRVPRPTDPTGLTIITTTPEGETYQPSVVWLTPEQDAPKPVEPTNGTARFEGLKPGGYTAWVMGKGMASPLAIEAGLKPGQQRYISKIVCTEAATPVPDGSRRVSDRFPGVVVKLVFNPDGPVSVGGAEIGGRPVAVAERLDPVRAITALSKPALLSAGWEKLAPAERAGLALAWVSDMIAGPNLIRTRPDDWQAGDPPAPPKAELAGDTIRVAAWLRIDLPNFAGTAHQYRRYGFAFAPDGSATVSTSTP